MTHHLGIRDLRLGRDSWQNTWLRIVTDRHQASSVEPTRDGMTEGQFLGNDPIHFISAWNPRNQHLHPLANRTLHQQLDDWIHDHDLPIWEGTGFASDGSWRQEGFALVGLSRQQALDVGRRWGQESIWEWNRNNLVLLESAGSKETRFGWVRAPLPARPPFMPGGLVPAC